MAFGTQQTRRTVYGAFARLIDTDTANRIITTMSQFTNPRAMVESVHLLLHSPGGQIPDGVAIYNFFRAFPLPLTVYNCGTVSSAAVLAFLGARARRASAHATFGIHKCSMTFEKGAPASDLQRFVKLTMLEDARTEAIFRAAGPQVD